MQPFLQWKSNKYCIFCVCVFVDLCIQRAMRMHHIVFCCLSGSTEFLHIVL